MLATVLRAPRDIHCAEVDEPQIQKPTDAFIKLAASCVCGSDLWPYRGIQTINGPRHMGHEYCGMVVEVGAEVRNIRPGQFVVGSFCLSDNTCPHCRYGFQSSCEHREFMGGAQAPCARVALADGTLVATDEMPSADLIPSLLAASDVLDTGWYAADAAWEGPMLFFQQKSLVGGPAPVRRFLPHLIDLIMTRQINPGKVFDLEVPLSDVAQAYKAMDERSAIKALLRM